MPVAPCPLFLRWEKEILFQTRECILHTLPLLIHRSGLMLKEFLPWDLYHQRRLCGPTTQMRWGTALPKCPTSTLTSVRSPRMTPTSSISTTVELRMRRAGQFATPMASGMTHDGFISSFSFLSIRFTIYCCDSNLSCMILGPVQYLNCEFLSRDLSKCYGAPIVMSLPYFMEAPDFLR